MFFQNRRVEEELERIRKANLPPKKEDGGEDGEFETMDAADCHEIDEFETSNSEIIDETGESSVTDDLRLTPKDILAMTIAALSIVIPYALLFIGVAVLFIFLFFAR